MKSRVGNTAAARATRRPDTAAKRAALSRLVALDKAEGAAVMGVPAAELTANVQRAMVALSTQAESLRSELKQARARIAQLELLADRDSLTPLLNRRAFVRELSRVMAFAERYGVTSGSLLYFDINGMKQINDRFGHGAGDAVLTHVARVMIKLVRGTDVVGRLGGDEFGVILAQADAAATGEKAAMLATAIRETPAIYGGERLPIGVAYGIHCFSSGEGVDAALDAADQAMYAQKHPPCRSV
jgi:diguanylate cyclase (GGDEF)-like protein